VNSRKESLQHSRSHGLMITNLLRNLLMRLMYDLGLLFSHSHTNIHTRKEKKFQIFHILMFSFSAN